MQSEQKFKIYCTMVAEWHNGPWKLLPLMYSWSTPINISFWLSFLCRSKECEENEVSIGFVLKILWGTKISLDGDGGFRLGHSGVIITPYFWGFRKDFFRIQLYRKKCDPSILHTDCCKYLFKKNSSPAPDLKKFCLLRLRLLNTGYQDPLFFRIQIFIG